MAVTFVAAGTAAGGTGSVTPGMPAGATTDDLLILVIEGEGEDTSADSPPTGGAWNTIGSVASATDGAVDRTRCSVYWAWYDAGINRTVPDAGNHTMARVYAFRGVDATTPLDGVTPASGSSSTNATSHSAATGLTSASDGAMAILAYSHGDDALSSPGTPTNANLASVNDGGAADTSSGSDGTVGLLYGIRTTAGAIGTFAWSTSATEERAWWAFVLRPDSGGPTEYQDSQSGAITPAGVVTTSTDAAPRSFAGTITPTGELAAAAIPLRTGIVKLGIAAGSGPTTDMNQVSMTIHHGTPSVADDIDIKWWLYQGVTLISSGTLNAPNESITYQTISLVSATQITNWANLEVWFQGINNTPGGSGEARIYEVRLVYPYVEGATQYEQSVAGSFTPAGADPVVLVATSPDGALSPAAVVVRSTARRFTGTLTSAGAVAKATLRRLTGAIGSAGAVAKLSASSLVGAAAPAGIVVRHTAHKLVGTVTSAGELVTDAIGGVASLLLEGTLTAAGVVGRLTSRTMSGVVASAGTAIRQTAKRITGTITSAGDVATEVLAGITTLALEGALTVAGTVSKAVSTTVTGLVSSSGTVVTQAIGVIVQLAVDGALTLAGTVRKLTATATTGALSPAGTVLRGVLQRLSGIIASAGNLVAQAIGGLAQLAVTGTLTSAGTVSKAAATTVDGELVPVGIVIPILIGEPTTGTVVLRYEGALGSTSTMANVTWNVRYGTAAAAPNTTLYLALKDGTTTIATYEHDGFSDGSVQVLAFDCSSSTQILDWSNLRLEAYAVSDPADSVPVRIYDTWLRYPSAGGFMVDLDGYLLFGQRGAWPRWDDAWEGGLVLGAWPSWDDVWFGQPAPKITKQVHTSRSGLITSAGLMLDEGKILVFTAVLTFIGDVTARIFGPRRPSGTARARPRPTVDVDAAEPSVAPAADGTTVDPNDFASAPHPVNRRSTVDPAGGPTQVDPE